MRAAAPRERHGVQWMGPVFWLLAGANLSSGLWMLFAPVALVPEHARWSSGHGAFNQHFVRDLGAAFFTIGVAFLAAAPKALTRRGVLLGATLFDVLHSLVHVTDLLTGRLHTNHWSMDFPFVFLPTTLLIILAFPSGGPSVRRTDCGAEMH